MQYSTAGGPLIAVLAMIVLVLLCRWTFSTDSRARRAPRAPRSGPRDYGLLVPVAVVRTDDDAELLRGVLVSAGIRGTVAEGPGPGDRSVLVFRADADRARSLVASQP